MKAKEELNEEIKRKAEENSERRKEIRQSCEKAIHCCYDCLKCKKD